MTRLRHEPDGAVPSVDALLGTALALEQDAVRRYGELAALMERLGNADTATVFRALVEEERDHAGGVARWAERLGRPAPAAEPQAWRLPADIAASWEELLGRARVTPYQALSVAVRNEEQAFAFFAYVAAHAGDAELRVLAERLAAEELGHAALLRRERRKAYRREGRAPAPPPGRGLTPAAFAERLAGFADDEELADWLSAVAESADDEAVMLAAQEALAAAVKRLAGRG
ncbi:ferritin-like domain-containing protein [Azospirillum sp. ST 5-10]|uniref:ferritin-like domain-containing protein n=1 Tax=unclassified Azospirillum TaxID=2630922 RepID=UPI003F49C76D